jgi:hypothetical protein
VGALWAPRCGNASGIEQVYASLPHEEAWNRAPLRMKREFFPVYSRWDEKSACDYRKSGGVQSATIK